MLLSPSPSSLAGLSRRRALRSSEQPPREVAAAGGRDEPAPQKGSSRAAVPPELGPERAGARLGGRWALGGGRRPAAGSEKEGRGSRPPAEG